MATKLLLREVWKAYLTDEDENAVSALEAVDLTVAESEFIAIVGPPDPATYCDTSLSF
jgi:ABC-type lipoprotein export system ATPase subunit